LAREGQERQRCAAVFPPIRSLDPSRLSATSGLGRWFLPRARTRVSDGKLEAHATHPLSAVQIEYSLWTRDVEVEILSLCEELGIGFVAYSPLGRGFLTGKITDIVALRPGDARRNMPRFQRDNLRRNLGLVEELKELAVAEKCTPAQLALAWVKSRADYIVPIPGTSHRHRLEENAAAVSLKISADTSAALLKLFAPGAASGLRYPENHLARLGI
jgi:aryl-alcohol dehydrogenase-like predicted oxidoreductase